MSNLRVLNCNMELTLDIIGGKWKSIIIYHVGTNKAIRYAELRKIMPDISERVLSRELKLLVENGISVRKELESKKSHVEYSLTSIGKEVLPVLNALTKWGAKYNAKYQYAKVLKG